MKEIIKLLEKEKAKGFIRSFSVNFLNTNISVDIIGIKGTITRDFFADLVSTGKNFSISQSVQGVLIAINKD